MLRGNGEQILSCVLNHADDGEWKEWLRLPLEHALGKGDVGLARMLLEARADDDAGYKGTFGRSLLGAVAEGGGVGTVGMMLDAGCGPDVNVSEEMVGEEQIALSATPFTGRFRTLGDRPDTAASPRSNC